MPRDGRSRWSKEQETQIKELYSELGPKKLAEMLGVDKKKLTQKANRLGLNVGGGFDWTPGLVDALRKRYSKDGPTLLAAEFGTTTWAVVAKARRLGLKPTRKVPPSDLDWVAVDEQLRLRYVKEGGTDIANEFGLGLEAIRKRASSMGLHTKAGYAKSGKIRASNSKSCNIHYFDQWSPNMAYILGFLFADGCINKKKTSATVRLAAKDRGVAEFIKEQTESIQKIYEYEGRVDPRTGNTNQDQVCFMLNSTELVEKLISIGLKPQKTTNDDTFPKVPEDVLHHFIRGYFDGDGTACISGGFCTVGFVGSPRFVKCLANHLYIFAGMQYKNPVRRKGKTTDWVTVAWAANRDVKAFRQYVYPEEGYDFCLQRKKDVIDKYLSEPRWDRGSFFGNRFTGSLYKEESEEE